MEWGDARVGVGEEMVTRPLSCAEVAEPVAVPEAVPEAVTVAVPEAVAEGAEPSAGSLESVVGWLMRSAPERSGAACAQPEFGHNGRNGYRNVAENGGESNEKAEIEPG